jgi:hypothetical protein
MAANTQRLNMLFGVCVGGIIWGCPKGSLAPESGLAWCKAEPRSGGPDPPIAWMT